MSVASAWTLTGRASARTFPHETASSGVAPESEPSKEAPVFTKTAWLAPLRMRLALQMWCFTKPPPKMSMPERRALRAMLLSVRMSCARSEGRGAAAMPLTTATSGLAAAAERGGAPGRCRGRGPGS